MKKFNTSPISGTQELLPDMQVVFNRLKDKIATTFYRHGFQNIETPTIERTTVLLAKAGGDTEKQIYKVMKTAETGSGAEQALRFDHTVPLSRYVVEHLNDLTFPFRVSQIGRNFRGERTQKGRFREFYQCDIDVIGWGELPIFYDAEVISTLVSALKQLPLPNQFYVRISNRKLLNGLLAELNLETHSTAILGIIDHAEKVSATVTLSALQSLGIGEVDIDKVVNFMNLSGSRQEIIPQLRDLGFTNVDYQTGLDELDQVLAMVEAAHPDQLIFADMKIVRGLDYYTGTVFETNVKDCGWLGSICSGGRYDNLASNYTDSHLPGVGGSIGLTRLFDALRDCGAVHASEIKPVDICLIPLDKTCYDQAISLAAKLRREGKSVDLVLTNKKLGDKIKYASKIAQSMAILGEDEIKAKTYKLRDLKTGAEQIEHF